MARSPHGSWAEIAPGPAKRSRRRVSRLAFSKLDRASAKLAAEKLAALMTVDYLEERAKRGARKKFEAALKRLPDVEPADDDKL